MTAREPTPDAEQPAPAGRSATAADSSNNAVDADTVQFPGRIWDLIRWPMPNQDRWRSRVAIKLAASVGRKQVRAIVGAHNMDPANDPFIMAVSHNIMREALIVPGMIMLVRGGGFVHFLADWNYMMIPVIGFIMRHGGTITVSRKPARPAFLDVFRPLYRYKTPTAERTRQALREGRSVGLFPEGTVNRNPTKLLHGRVGTARLSLESGLPVVPVGIRFPDAPTDQPLDEHAAMELHIGTAIYPPPISGDKPTLAEARAWHAEIMKEIGRLSGKTWTPKTRKVGRDGEVYTPE